MSLRCDYHALSRERFTKYEAVAQAQIFKRRSECVVWDSRGEKLYGSSHGGEICLIHTSGVTHTDDLLEKNVKFLRQGSGKGGSICHMMLTLDERSLLLSSHDCTFTCFDLEMQTEFSHLSTGDYDWWFTCSAYSHSTFLIAVSDNKGNVHFIDQKSSSSAGQHKLHRNEKIGCIDFNAAGNIFATASNDRTCRIFDIRMLTSESGSSQRKRNEIAVYAHDGVVSSCYFSPINISAMLTTSQNDEIRVMDISEAGELVVPRCVFSHPHRFYQHLTVIKAVWHPIANDLVCCGRYDELRGLDFFDVSKQGIEKGQAFNLRSSNVKTILCVNAFSPSGDKLASASGTSIILWNKDTGSNLHSDIRSRLRGAVDAQAEAFENGKHSSISLNFSKFNNADSTDSFNFSSSSKGHPKKKGN
jgi:DNA damage-binding protein 2